MVSSFASSHMVATHLGPVCWWGSMIWSADSSKFIELDGHAADVPALSAELSCMLSFNKRIGRSSCYWPRCKMNTAALPVLNLSCMT